MSRIVISNSDLTTVKHSSTQNQTARTRDLTTWSDYFDHYVVEEYQGDSVAGYLGHKLTGASFVFGSVFLSPLLAAGCTAEMDKVEGFTKVKDGGNTDNGGGLDLTIPEASATDTESSDAEMSQPDDAMTLIDTVQQDGATDTTDINDAGMTDGDEGVDGATDIVTPLDGDAEVVADTDATIADGDVGVEVKDAGLDDGPVGTDATADEGVAPEAKDSGEIPDAFDADLDNGAPGTDAGLDADADANGVTDTIAPPPDSDAAIDQSTDDGIAETEACIGKPTCAAGPGMVVKKDPGGTEYIEVNINKGGTAKVTFLMSGTNYDCTNPSLQAAELPGAPTPITITYSEAESAPSFLESCTTYIACKNGQNLIESCPPVKVNVNQAPVIKQLKGPQGLGILPSGDQCFSATNSLQFTWEASDADKDPLSCTVNVTETAGGKSAATVSVTQAAGAAMTANIPANSLKPRTDYCWNLSCTDGKSAAIVTGGNTCFTTSEKGLIGWWRFDEKDGLIAHDSSGNGLDGELIGFDPAAAWQNGTLFFNGKTSYVKVVTGNKYDVIDSLQFETSLQISSPPNSWYQAIINKMSNLTEQTVLLEIEPDQSVVFVACPAPPCTFSSAAQSLKPIDNQLHAISGTFDNTGVTLTIDGIPQTNKVKKQDAVPTPTPFIFGDWAAGINNLAPRRPLFGKIDYIVLWKKMALCP